MNKSLVMFVCIGSLALAVMGCKEEATSSACPADCDKPCCAVEKKACPADCTKPCCAVEKPEASCPAGCTKPCCAS